MQYVWYHKAMGKIVRVSVSVRVRVRVGHKAVGQIVRHIGDRDYKC